MKIPKPYQKIFWDVPCSDLHWQQHKYFVIARFLSYGSMAALQWLENHHHFLSEMPEFLASTHARRLDKKTLNFWKMYYGIEQLSWETPTYKRLRQGSWID